MSVGPAQGTADPRPTQTTARSATDMTATSEVFRDIARGGLAGLIVGILLAGIGGRLVMRLAALLVPDAAGSVTEQGFVVGVISLAGTMGLVVAMGLFAGAAVGAVWVVIRPWLPSTTTARAIVSVPIAIGLGTTILIDASNPDFFILGHDPVVIGSLVLLVAAFGPAMTLVDAWLDRHLPHPGPGGSAILTVYGVIAAIGSLLTLFVIAPFFLQPESRVVGIALIVIGLATLASWGLRIAREREPGPRITWTARGAVTIATAAGLVAAAPEVLGALGA
jgi:hypothetical protein